MADCKMIVIWILLLQVFVARVAVVEGVTVSIENEMTTVGQQLSVHCKQGQQDMGVMLLDPFHSFSFKFTQSVFGTSLYTCVFQTAGKPITTIDVFKGFAYRSPPCNCNGISYCAWQVLNDGFWCNSNFVQKW